MKFNKALLTLSSLMLLMSITACNSGENKNNGAKSDPTSSSQTTPSSSGSTSSEPLVNPTILPALNVIVYNKFATTEQSDALKAGFESFLHESNVQITNLVWDLKITGGVSDLNTEIETYNTEHPSAKYDVILGGKAYSGCTYINNNYESLKDGEGTPIDMTIGESTDRRVWLLNESPNAKAIKLLVKNVVNYDIPDPDPDPGTDVQPIPNPDTTLPELNVILYKKYVTDEQAKDLKNNFITYLNTNSVGITSLVWNIKVTGGVSDLNDEISAYNTANPDAKYDVILGGKAFSGCDYINGNYTSVKDGEGTPIDMTIGTNTDRRVWLLNSTDNAEAKYHIVKHLLDVEIEY